MTQEMRSFLQLIYSLCKQYISWYDREIKILENHPKRVYNDVRKPLG